MGIIASAAGISALTTTTAQSGSQAHSAASSTYGNDPAVQAFEKYMNESVAQRFEDQWLAAHHLTEQDLKNMSPAQRQQIMNEIAQDMKRAIDQQVQQKAKTAIPLSST